MQLVFPGIFDLWMKNAYTRLLTGMLRFRQLLFKSAILPIKCNDLGIARRSEILRAQVDADELSDATRGRPRRLRP